MEQWAVEQMRNDIHEKILERRTWSFNGLSSLWIFRQFQQMWLQMRLILSVVAEQRGVWGGEEQYVTLCIFCTIIQLTFYNSRNKDLVWRSCEGGGRNIIPQHHSSQGSRQLTSVLILISEKCIKIIHIYICDIIIHFTPVSQISRDAT